MTDQGPRATQLPVRLPTWRSRTAALVQGVLFLIAIAGPHPARADMIDTSGMQPWEICGLCHSLDGISAMARFPKLAGQRPDYIIKQFRDFHGGSRQNDGGQMQAITTEIDMEELPKIAAYFSDLPPPPAVQPDDMGGLSSAGTIFREGRGDIPACLTCHGSTDPDLPLAPWLEAQHADYLAKQLNDFRQGNRSNDPDGVMRSIAARLSETDIETLTAFIAGQERPERTP